MHPIPVDRAQQVRFLDRLDHQIYIKFAKGLIKQRLNTAQIDQVEAASGNGRNDDVHVAARAGFATGDRTEDRRTRDPARLKTVANSAKNAEGVIEMHGATNIASGFGEFTNKRSACRSPRRG